VQAAAESMASQLKAHRVEGDALNLLGQFWGAMDAGAHDLVSLHEALEKQDDIKDAYTQVEGHGTEAFIKSQPQPRSA